jgi:hypothetical protein
MRITSSNGIEVVTISTDEQFTSQLIAFVDKLENKEVFDKDIYSSLLSYNLNYIEFKKMIETIELFAFDDEDKEEINFPWEDWIERITSWEVIV